MHPFIRLFNEDTMRGIIKYSEDRQKLKEKYMKTDKRINLFKRDLKIEKKLPDNECEFTGRTN